MKFMLLILLSFLAVVSAAGDSHMTASQKTVKVGDDAVLPCRLGGPYDKKTQRVEWTRNEKDVHLYRKGKDELDDQDKHFNGRTSLFYDEMDEGNISLKLSRVNEQDEGNYICHVGVNLDNVKQCDIRLHVEKRNTGGQRNAGPEPDPKPDTEPEPEQDHTKYGYISLVIPAFGILATGYWIWRKHRNNDAAPNRDFGPVQRQERNRENQRNPDMGPEPGLGAEAGPEIGPEQRPRPGPGPVPGPEQEAEPVPGPNKDHGMSLRPHRRGCKGQSDQEKEHGQSQHNVSERHGTQVLTSIALIL